MKRPKRSETIHGSAAEVAADREGRPLRRWVRPTVVGLPRLTELTLQSTIPGACDCPGPGSVVIP
ncbi:hypothetical protein [Longimicrobium sp.]|uniref:hypothetical protein n=1 Tax=Longimicrobium sp. TaxID=2029185 RepID=UPI002C21FE2B|nr:hypothetical protein [Longimicrobium sp.]HSU14735.1 hypothetical protein [Longimicrobium sp.]